jgi:hypothetical protein
MDDERPAEQRHDGPTFADTKAKQDEFEALLREEERGDDAEDDFEEAAEAQRAGRKPDETPPSESMP